MLSGPGWIIPTDHHRINGDRGSIQPKLAHRWISQDAYWPRNVSAAYPPFFLQYEEITMQLLTQEIRQKLPPLGSQDGKGGDAIAYAKFFTPSSSWTWYVTEGSPEGDDFTFFGLVEGFEKELGYFSLAELQSVRGPMGLPIERDLYWKPKTLKEIAPELFKDAVNEGVKP
jgi:hypothetical protein